MPEDYDPGMHDGSTAFEKNVTDQYVHAGLNLSQGEILRKEKVIG